MNAWKIGGKDSKGKYIICIQGQTDYVEEMLHAWAISVSTVKPQSMCFSSPRAHGDNPEPILGCPPLIPLLSLPQLGSLQSWIIHRTSEECSESPHLPHQVLHTKPDAPHSCTHTHCIHWLYFLFLSGLSVWIIKQIWFYQDIFITFHCLCHCSLWRVGPCLMSRLCVEYTCICYISCYCCG